MRTVSSPFSGRLRKNLQKLDSSSSFNSGLDAIFAQNLKSHGDCKKQKEEVSRWEELMVCGWMVLSTLTRDTTLDAFSATAFSELDRGYEIADARTTLTSRTQMRMSCYTCMDSLERQFPNLYSLKHPRLRKKRKAKAMITRSLIFPSIVECGVVKVLDVQISSSASIGFIHRQVIFDYFSMLFDRLAIFVGQSIFPSSKRCSNPVRPSLRVKPINRKPHFLPNVESALLGVLCKGFHSAVNLESLTLPYLSIDARFGFGDGSGAVADLSGVRVVVAI